MTDLAAWLSAQLDAEEKSARREYQRLTGHDWSGEMEPHGPNLSRHHIAANVQIRRLRTIAAHRAILRRHERSITFGWCRVCWEQDPQAIAPEGHDMGRMDWPCPDVRSIAAIYESRDGFDPSWKVET